MPSSPRHICSRCLSENTRIPRIWSPDPFIHSILVTFNAPPGKRGNCRANPPSTANTSGCFSCLPLTWTPLVCSVSSVSCKWAKLASWVVERFWSQTNVNSSPGSAERDGAFVSESALGSEGRRGSEGARKRKRFLVLWGNNERERSPHP